jgi:hypothetical protein
MGSRLASTARHLPALDSIRAELARLVVATTASALLKVTGVLPSTFEVGEGGLGNLAHTDYSTVLVALAVQRLERGQGAL